MSKRPVPLTVCAWFLILMGGVSLLSSQFTLYNPNVQLLLKKSAVPLILQYIIIYTGFFVMVFVGFGILKKKLWSRMVYVAWNFFSLTLGLLTSPVKAAMLPGVVIFVIVVHILFREDTTDFFRSE